MLRDGNVGTTGGVDSLLPKTPFDDCNRRSIGRVSHLHRTGKHSRLEVLYTTYDARKLKSGCHLMVAVEHLLRRSSFQSVDTSKQAIDGVEK